jgi:hypothetical protein
MTTYVSVARQSAGLQAVLDAHAVSASTGRCLVCDVVEAECEMRRGVLASLGQLQQLPQRRPGATQPERIGVRRVAVGRG